MHTTRPKSPTDSPNAISTPPVIEIRSLAPGDDTTAFRTLNEEWIMQYFTLEAKDRETLNDPVHSILLKGGHIFMAYAAAEAVGCVALVPMRDYELSKMAVSPHRPRPRPPFAAARYRAGQRPRCQVSISWQQYAPEECCSLVRISRISPRGA